MPDNVKVLIAERNGVELQFKEELALLPENIPFTEGTFTATDVKAAIVENKLNAGLSRVPLLFSYNANSNNGRWLELGGNASNTTPFIVAANASIVAASVSVQDVVTSSTFTIFANGIADETITILADKKANKTFVSPLAILAGTGISVQQTTGNSTQNPTLVVFIKISAT